MATWCINSEKIIGRNDFPYHFKKIVVRYKNIGYNINVMRQTACLVVNPIKVNSFAYFFMNIALLLTVSSYISKIMHL